MIPATLRLARPGFASALRTSAPKMMVGVRFNSNSGNYTLSPQLLADLPARWETMGPADQANVWMTLRDRMAGDWKEMTREERVACKILPVAG